VDRERLAYLWATVRYRQHEFTAGIWNQYVHHVGRRGLLLIILTITSGLYGVALVTSTPVVDTWWPAFDGEVFGVSVDFWGALWIALACFLLLGVPIDTDQLQFAAVVLMLGVWACAAFYSTRFWGPGVIYTGLAFVVLLGAGWPDPRYVREPRVAPIDPDRLDEIASLLAADD
jgi:hypothetical protein